MCCSSCSILVEASFLFSLSDILHCNKYVFYIKSKRKECVHSSLNTRLIQALLFTQFVAGTMTVGLLQWPANVWHCTTQTQIR